MSPIVRLSCAALCVAAVLLGPSAPPVHAADQEMPKALAKALDKQLDQIVKDHRRGIVTAMKAFKAGARDLRTALKEGEKSSIPSRTVGELDAAFRGFVEATRTAIEAIELEALAVYEVDPDLPDQADPLGADPRSLVAATVARLNQANAKAVTKLGRAMEILERHAAAANVPLRVIIRGMPTFLAPHVERDASFGSGMTTSSVHILATVAGAFVLSGSETMFRTFEMLGYSDPPSSGNARRPVVGLFEPDGSQVGLSIGSISPAGLFRGTFGAVPAGVKVVSVDLRDDANDNPAAIFADGFESGDASAWSATAP